MCAKSRWVDVAIQSDWAAPKRPNSTHDATCQVNPNALINFCFSNTKVELKTDKLLPTTKNSISNFLNL